MKVTIGLARRGPVILSVIVALAMCGASAAVALEQSASEDASGVSQTVRYGDGTRVNPVVDAVVRTTPHVLLNAAPGFGIGSYLQRDVRSGVVLTLADLVAWGLLIPSVLVLNDDSLGDDEGGLAVLTMFAGYGVYGVSRIAAIAYPIRHVVRSGVDQDSLLAPIFYNMLPGFGIGSFIQGDARGARLILALDATAYVALGVLSGAALGGAETLAAVSGITLMAVYGSARVLGIVLPIVYRSGRVVADTPG